MGNCKRDGHGKFEKSQCPKCCVHKGQVYLEAGPKCSDCGRALVWVQAHQLTDTEHKGQEGNTNG